MNFDAEQKLQFKITLQFLILQDTKPPQPGALLRIIRTSIKHFKHWSAAQFSPLPFRRTFSSGAKRTHSTRGYVSNSAARRPFVKSFSGVHTAPRPSPSPPKNTTHLHLYPHCSSFRNISLLGVRFCSPTLWSFYPMSLFFGNCHLPLSSLFCTCVAGLTIQWEVLV